MNGSGLTRTKFLRVAEACEQFLLPEHTPDYFQEFLVSHLRESGDEDLAQRVALLGEGQMHELCERLRVHQAGPP